MDGRLLEGLGTIRDGSPRARAVGRRIGGLLRRCSWSEEDLARAMEVSEGTVRGMVEGEGLTSERIVGCAEALGAELEEIVGFLDEVAELLGEEEAEPPPKATPEQAEEIRRRLRAETDPRGPQADAEPVSEEEFRSLLRWMVDEAVKAQERIDREKEERARRAKEVELEGWDPAWDEVDDDVEGEVDGGDGGEESHDGTRSEADGGRGGGQAVRAEAEEAEGEKEGSEERAGGEDDHDGEDGR